MNRLRTETSPYLRQHAGNPVDWYPWGDEALRRAREEDRPILLSIGYAACHWCHVMERESFENAETAKLMNDAFVCIKVDREERPDLDAIYMSATQAMTGHGGWPMTVFLTPEGAPFYAGTYFPPDDRHGMPSFRRVLQSVRTAYATQRADVDKTAAQIKEMYQRASAAMKPSGPLTAQTLDRAYRGIAGRYDVRNGGFEGAPKFPQTMTLDFLLRYWRRTGTTYALEMSLSSFRAMARGGIYDQVGGGFHRYAVDAIWLVPHFEKMLYDNALLIELGAHLVQATDDAEVARVVEETIGWVGAEMTDRAGGFYASLDADSEGVEGKFYVWSEGELDELLGDDAAVFKMHYGVTASGNFEGHNILFVPADLAVTARRAQKSEAETAELLARAGRVLYAARARRVWPGRDEKILAGWNGLMVRAIAVAARVMGRDDWRALAITNGEFLFREMVRGGRVLRTHGGSSKLSGFLEDHAAVGLAALALYELTLERGWLDRARDLAASVVRWFWDEPTRSFFDTAIDHETLVTRPRDVTDNAVPSGTSLACDLLRRIAVLTDDETMRGIVAGTLEALAEPMARHGGAFGWMLGVADAVVHGATEVALVGEADAATFAALRDEVARHYLPALSLAASDASGPDDVALLRGRSALDGRATAYVCRHYTCELPATDVATLAAQLDRAARATPAP